MSGVRVMELAKETGLSSKEMLARLKELDIQAKSHASMLSEEDVAKVRESMKPESSEELDVLDKKDNDKLKLEQKRADKKREKEEAARRAAVAHELAERKAEKAAKGDNTPSPKKTPSKGKGKPASKKAPKADTSTGIESLANQIEEQKRKAEAAERERKAKEKAERMAEEVAKKQAVEQSLRNKGKKQQQAADKAQTAPASKGKKPSSKEKAPDGKYSSLLSQIESEQKRINANSEQVKKPKKPKKRTKNVQVVPELEQTQNSEDRYAQMAAQAEKLQRDKVLAEARAAVAAAANSNGGEGRRKRRKQKREQEARERAEMEAIERGIDPALALDDSVVEIPQGATVAKLAELLSVQPNDVVKRLFMLGQPLTLTQSMSDDLIEIVADDMGRKVRVVSPEEEYAIVYNDTEDDLKPRPPVVTVMGHVDHGKTSLLDAIRDTGVVENEAGGITQHIGASVVDINGRQITFIDTPGHEAFTAMRARGAQVTDVIVLVVAADDGVMPQTIEAINHAKAADVPIVVAVNKIDKDGANPDRVRQELTEYGVIPEDWGGQNMFVNVSAKKRLYIDELLETIILQADVLELKANPDALASGFVIEANLDKGRGPVATVLIQRGTLHPGDAVVAGTSYGHVRALIDPHGEHVENALPADPVEILGLNSVPVAGDEFRVFEDERDARKLAEERLLRERLAEQQHTSHMSLDDLFSRIEEGKQTDLNLIVKADVQGSIEALRDAFDKMDQSEVRINIVHSAVGGITETDVTLAAASDAIIIGFNVRPTGKSRQQAEKEKVDIRLYKVIYQAIEDINSARVGLLSPDIIEEDTGIAEVRELFKVPKVGTIAGCYVVEGEISRNDKVRIVRDGTVVFEGDLASLRRFKDDVSSVRFGYECGIGIEGFQDIKVGDTIESFTVKEVERTE